MSKAEKMFKDLGYSEFVPTEYGGYYSLPLGSIYTKDISFWHKSYTDSEHEVCVMELATENDEITISEHLAIHEKLKELGWLDE